MFALQKPNFFLWKKSQAVFIVIDFDYVEFDVSNIDSYFLKVRTDNDCSDNETCDMRFCKINHIYHDDTTCA